MKTQIANNKKLIQDLKKAQLFTRMLILQQEEDKKIISRELHDEVAQVLTAINYELALLSKEAAKHIEGIRDKILKSQKLIENSLQSIHLFAKKLRPMSLDHLGLVPALKTYIKEFVLRNKIEVKFHCDVKLDNLTDIVKTVVYRVIQEALMNIEKHAKASCASITIRKIKKILYLEIQDNGVSFSVAKSKNIHRNKRIGLIGMAERIIMINGKLHIVSNKKNGTLIKVQIPLAKKINA